MGEGEGGRWRAEGGSHGASLPECYGFTHSPIVSFFLFSLVYARGLLVGRRGIFLAASVSMLLLASTVRLSAKACPNPSRFGRHV